MPSHMAGHIRRRTRSAFARALRAPTRRLRTRASRSHPRPLRTCDPFASRSTLPDAPPASRCRYISHFRSPIMDLSTFPPITVILDALYNLVIGVSNALGPVAGPSSTALAIVALTLAVRLLLVPASIAQVRAEIGRRRLA